MSDSTLQIPPDSVLVVREGPSANCSSIGSVVDALFVTATVGSALFVAVAAALATERITIVGDESRGDETQIDEAGSDDAPSD